MTEERLSPAELRQQQEKREREAEENERKAREARNQAAEDAELKRRQAAAQKVVASWYSLVVEAAKHDRVRFAVVAQLVGKETSEVLDARAAITAEGYETDVVNINLPASKGRRGQGLPSTSDDALVTDGQVLGWKAANVPIIGLQGEVRFLVVRW